MIIPALTYTERQAPADRLKVGDLVCVDERLDVVESVEQIAPFQYAVSFALAGKRVNTGGFFYTKIELTQGRSAPSAESIRAGGGPPRSRRR